ncbi:d5 family helicase-primase [Lasius niger]|uniref:D5 family helicase-primase n=1 Tax=Lasius niger TaxID=67767 RepID=A0A0J7K5U8_LASNI|nr:d5 family helicase-primase [Lasius niger]
MAPSLLKSFTELKNVPQDSYVFYDMSGGKYYLSRNDYPYFWNFHVRTNRDQRQNLTLDLAFAQSHSLVFDIDVKILLRGAVTYKLASLYLKHYTKTYVLPVLRHQFSELKNFTVLVATRIERDGDIDSGGVGMHVHLPEIAIAHDDYVRLCARLQPLLFDASQKWFHISLDIPTNWTLSLSKKPGRSSCYKPSSIHYVDERKSHDLDLLLRTNWEDIQDCRKDFKRRKDNTRSCFRRVLYAKFHEIVPEIQKRMMPVQPDPSVKLSYETIFSTGGDDEEERSSSSEEYEKVASFQFRRRHRTHVYKGLIPNFKGVHWLRAAYYLQANAYLIDDFETDNYALKTWYRNHRDRLPSVSDDLFLSVNRALAEDSINFRSDANPIKTILEYRDGYYFLPVFYALCRHLDIPSRTLIQHLRGIVDSHALLDRLENINPEIIRLVSKNFTIDTILFCGFHMHGHHSRYKEVMQEIVKYMKGVISAITSPEMLAEQIRHVQERNFPLMMVSMQNSCKEPQKFLWSPVKDCWYEFKKDQNIGVLMNAIFSDVKIFVKTAHSDRSKELLAGINVQLLVSSVINEMNHERKVLAMDRQKWFVRTENGVLDLLTGHVGANVPEGYMTNRRLGVAFDRRLLSVMGEDKTLLSTYSALTDRLFFRRYLKRLYTNVTDDVFETLRDMAGFETGHPLVESCLQFYANLCKYVSFDYDKLMYLMDVLASLLIATNYARKFFIFKGETRNGKSKFFQMIERVFGELSQTIRSQNLQPGTSGSSQTAQPEFATTMFACRIVTVEEMSGRLNENLVKELTGNSTTSFRNLFEQNAGGIPTAKIFASTNTIPICTATEAFKDRVVAFPFESMFVSDAATLDTRQQLQSDRFPLDTSDGVIESSYKGFFVMIYCHLRKRIDMEDGLIRYRPEPDSLKEFKEILLRQCDLFTQFVSWADVQESTGYVTTQNQLKSAVRLFKKHMKHVNFQETDLLVRFDEVYGHLKQSEDDDGTSSPVETLDSFLNPTGIAAFVDEDDFDRRDVAGGSGSKKRRFEEDEDLFVTNNNKKIKLDDVAGGSGGSNKRRLEEEEDLFVTNNNKKIKLDPESERSMMYYRNVVIKILNKKSTF